MLVQFNRRAIEGHGIVPQKSKHASHRFRALNEFLYDGKRLGLGKVHVVAERSVHHDQRDFEEISLPVLFQQPRAIWYGGAGAKPRLIGESDGAVVRQAAALPVDPGLRAPTE